MQVKNHRIDRYQMIGMVILGEALEVAMRSGIGLLLNHDPQTANIAVTRQVDGAETHRSIGEGFSRGHSGHAYSPASRGRFSIDASGLDLNTMITLMSLVASIFAPLFALSSLLA